MVWRSFSSRGPGLSGTGSGIPTFPMSCSVAVLTAIWIRLLSVATNHLVAAVAEAVGQQVSIGLDVVDYQQATVGVVVVVG